jgi:hypothetical protein
MEFLLLKASQKFLFPLLKTENWAAKKALQNFSVGNSEQKAWKQKRREKFYRGKVEVSFRLVIKELFSN